MRLFPATTFDVLGIGNAGHLQENFIEFLAHHAAVVSAQLRRLIYPAVDYLVRRSVAESLNNFLGGASQAPGQCRARRR